MREFQAAAECISMASVRKNKNIRKYDKKNWQNLNFSNHFASGAVIYLFWLG